MGVSAYHLLQKQHIDFFTKSFRHGAGLCPDLFHRGSCPGHMNGAEVAESTTHQTGRHGIALGNNNRALRSIFWSFPTRRTNGIWWNSAPFRALLSMLAYHDTKPP